jgi:hypothetical protein
MSFSKKFAGFELIHGELAKGDLVLYTVLGLKSSMRMTEVFNTTVVLYQKAQEAPPYLPANHGVSCLFSVPVG